MKKESEKMKAKLMIGLMCLLMSAGCIADDMPPTKGGYELQEYVLIPIEEFMETKNSTDLELLIEKGEPINYTIESGEVCFEEEYCVTVPHNTLLILTDDKSLITKKCKQYVGGCALFADIFAEEDTIVVGIHPFKETDTKLLKEFRRNKMKANTFHELLHMEYWYLHNNVGHPIEMLERDNAYRDHLGIMEGYIIE